VDVASDAYMSQVTGTSQQVLRAGMICIIPWDYYVSSGGYESVRVTKNRNKKK
jgi:hypothetical protein